MQGEKLYGVVFTLDSKTRKKLVQFSESPYNNTRQDLSLCLGFIAENCEALLDESISEKDLFSAIYLENDAFDKAKFRDLLHDCQNIFNDFAVDQSIKNNPNLKLQLLADFYNQTGSYTEYNQELKKGIKLLQNADFIDRKNELQLFDMKTKLYVVDEEDYLKNKKHLVEEALVHLDTFYFTEKLKWSHELMAMSHFTSQSYETPFVNNVLAEINKEPYSLNPFASIYYLITLFYKGNYSLDKYKRLKKNVESIITFVQEQERRSLIIDLNNYVVALYKESNNVELITEMHALNLLGIEHHVFIKKLKFNSHNAMNIVNIALRLGLREWAREFSSSIDNIIDNENALLIVKAMIAFELEDYEKVRSLLSNVEFTDVYFAMNAKSFLAKTYFMQEEYELLENHLAAMDLFYRRNKQLSKDLIQSNLNFVLTLKKIVKHAATPSKLTNLQNKIEGVNNMAYKAWVQKILKELLK